MSVLRPSWRRRLRSVFFWHRYLGAAASVFLLVLTVSGFALNHDRLLGLDGLRVDWGPIMALYGIAPERPPISFNVEGTWVTSLDGAWYLDGSRVAAHQGPAAGAALTGSGFLALAARDGLTLVTPAGEVVERVDGGALPAAIRRLGRDETGRLTIESPDATLFRADQAVVDWSRPPDTITPDWATPVQSPEHVREAVLGSYRGEGIPVTRLLADIHSGRLIGLSGQLAMDLAGLALLLLVGTGFYNWLRRRR